MGSANAAVLPVPVCALPITSLPESIKGIVRSWIGVGSTYPIAFTPSMMGLESPNLLNAMCQCK
jgi:hypothetical protein